MIQKQKETALTGRLLLILVLLLVRTKDDAALLPCMFHYI